MSPQPSDSRGPKRATFGKKNFCKVIVFTHQKDGTSWFFGLTYFIGKTVQVLVHCSTFLCNMNDEILMMIYFDVLLHISGKGWLLYVMKARQPNFLPVVEVGYIEALLSALSSVSPWKGDKHFTILSDWNTEAKIEK